MENCSFNNCYWISFFSDFGFCLARQEFVVCHVANKVFSRSLPLNKIKEVDTCKNNLEKLNDLAEALTCSDSKSCVGKKLHCTPKIHKIIWQPPQFPWIKVNTDGASKGNPGPAACGAVFRNHQGYFMGGLTMNLGFQDSLYAEMMAIIMAFQCAFEGGWNHLWLESDSTIALSLLNDDSNSRDLPPSTRELRDQWMWCKSKIKTINFHSSHIFREGNSVADFFANFGLTHNSRRWWSFPPHEDVQQLMLQDLHGIPKYRFR